MDGIEIQRILEDEAEDGEIRYLEMQTASEILPYASNSTQVIMEPVEEYPIDSPAAYEAVDDNYEIPSEDIARMIEINEGASREGTSHQSDSSDWEPGQPTNQSPKFKHLKKYTPDMAGLKRKYQIRKTSRGWRNAEQLASQRKVLLNEVNALERELRILRKQRRKLRNECREWLKMRDWTLKIDDDPDRKPGKVRKLRQLLADDRNNSEDDDINEAEEDSGDERDIDADRANMQPIASTTRFGRPRKTTHLRGYVVHSKAAKFVYGRRHAVHQAQHVSLPPSGKPESARKLPVVIGPDGLPIQKKRGRPPKPRPQVDSLIPEPPCAPKTPKIPKRRGRKRKRQTRRKSKVAQGDCDSTTPTIEALQDGLKPQHWTLEHDLEALRGEPEEPTLPEPKMTIKTQQPDEEKIEEVPTVPPVPIGCEMPATPGKRLLTIMPRSKSVATKNESLESPVIATESNTLNDNEPVSKNESLEPALKSETSAGTTPVIGKRSKKTVKTSNAKTRNKTTPKTGKETNSFLQPIVLITRTPIKKSPVRRPSDERLPFVLLERIKSEPSSDKNNCLSHTVDNSFTDAMDEEEVPLTDLIAKGSSKKESRQNGENKTVVKNEENVQTSVASPVNEIGASRRSGRAIRPTARMAELIADGGSHRTVVKTERTSEANRVPTPVQEPDQGTTEETDEQVLQDAGASSHAKANKSKRRTTRVRETPKTKTEIDESKELDQLELPKTLEETPTKNDLLLKSEEVAPSESMGPRRSGREVRLPARIVEMIQEEETANVVKHLLSRTSVSPAKNKSGDEEFQIGDLVWAKFGGPQWPAIVIPDSALGEGHVIRSPNQVNVHVQAIRQWDQHTWTPGKQVRRFTAESTDFEMSKDLEAAVLETETLIARSAEERIELVRSKIITPAVKPKKNESRPKVRRSLSSTPASGQRKAPVSETKPKKKRKISEIPDVMDKPGNPADADLSQVTPTSAIKKPKPAKRKLSENRSRPSKKTKMEDVPRDSRSGSVTSEVSVTPSVSSVSSDASNLSITVDQARQFMFRGLGSEKICGICRKVTPKLPPVLCTGVCCGYYHLTCALQGSASAQQSEADFKCLPCQEGKNPCFVCNSAQGTRQMCLQGKCGKFYHQKCLKLFPQTKFNHGARKNVGLQRDPEDTGEAPLEILSCSLHACHTCGSDNPANVCHESSEKLVTCVKCPTAYHSVDFCLPAGTEIRTKRQVLCGKHFELSSKSRIKGHVNCRWCFHCCKGGELILCDTCPSAIHAECLVTPPPEDGYICEECESGRFPLYGEVVWVKLGGYRWWPAKVVFPHQIPDSVACHTHHQCQFVVEFFGSHDYQWVNRGIVYCYNEGDKCDKFKENSKLDAKFCKALKEAAEEFLERKGAIAQHVPKSSKPPPYAKIQTNRYLQAKKGPAIEMPVCSCTANDPDPCGPSSECLNRLMLIECPPGLCPAGDKCQNRRFEKRQYPPLKIIKTGNRGWGLKSTVDLHQGQFVIEYVGEVITDDELNSRMKSKTDAKEEHFYFLQLNSNRVLDAEHMGNKARFINHSCDPNCGTQKWTVKGQTRVGIFAERDIPADTELTFNYDMEYPTGKIPCTCGTQACSGFIGVKKEEEKKKKPAKVSKKNSS